jgi:histidyl-tRNA synthetase
MKKRGRPVLTRRGRPSKPRKPKIPKIKIQAPRGVHDILPEEQKYWDKIYAVVSQVLPSYGFKKIDVPIFEDARLYLRGTGQSTDIVQKEMYTFKKGESEMLALRPEFTPGIARAYIEHGMKNLSQPVKLYTFGPVFRHDKPQAGRYRQFHQINWEILGDESPISDVQVIQVFINILKKLNLRKYTLYTNSIGCPICVSRYKKALINYYHSRQSRICADCKKRYQENPLRLLDCKNESCKKFISKAPQMIDFLCEECHNHFKGVLEFLDDLEIPYQLNPQLVRGIDYYTKTVFEFYEESKEALSQGAIMGGGRYDNLVEMFKGKPTPGVGAAAGIERIINIIRKQDIKVTEKEKPKVFLVQLGDLGQKKCLKLFEEFQAKGIRIGETLSKPSIKAQLKVADKEGAEIALIMGQREAIEGTIIVKDMKTSAQETIPLHKVINEVKKRLSK